MRPGVLSPESLVLEHANCLQLCFESDSLRNGNEIGSEKSQERQHLNALKCGNAATHFPAVFNAN